VIYLFPPHKISYFVPHARDVTHLAQARLSRYSGFAQASSPLLTLVIMFGRLRRSLQIALTLADGAQSWSSIEKWSKCVPFLKQSLCLYITLPERWRSLFSKALFSSAWISYKILDRIEKIPPSSRLSGLGVARRLAISLSMYPTWGIAVQGVEKPIPIQFFGSFEKKD